MSSRKRQLKLAPDLALPLEFATEGVAVIGMRGSGKSNTEARFAELLYEAGIPFVVVDPKGDWHGIRSSADGKQAGLSVPVFGGLHGDFPLEPSMGARIADLLVDENISAVLDLSAMSKTGGLPTFLTAFCNQLMHRHQLAPQVRTVILEEAHVYIPQVVTSKKSELKEAASRLLLEGRAFGLGCWAATQRPARLHKDVLEEVGTAIIHRIGVSATNDKDTIRGWVKHYDVGIEIVDSLTELKPGQAWVLIPEDGIVRCVQIDRRHTFDSAATPKVGAQARRPNTMADIDKGAITSALEDVLERAKVDDPAELRKRIRTLTEQVAHQGIDNASLERRIEELREQQREPVEVAVPFIPDWLPAMIANDVHTADEVAVGLRATAETLGHMAHRLERMSAARGSQMDDVRAIMEKSSTARPAPTQARTAPPRTTPPRPAAESSTMRASGGVCRTADAPKLKAGARRMLGELAQFPGGLKPGILSARAKVKRSGGSWGTYLSALRVAGYIEEGGDVIRATEAGIEAAGGAPPPMSADEMLADWRGRLKAGVRRMLDTLVAAYPEPVSADDLSAAAAIDRNGGSWGTYLSMLRTNDLMTEPEKGWYRASEAFFALAD